ncbi:MAG: ATP-binding protein, partial [Actinomycetes bacterium]
MVRRSGFPARRRDAILLPVPDQSASPPAESSEERRGVSVLFCDLVGFTHTSESSDPEDLRHLLGVYHAAVRQRVEALGGRVERLVGDGVLAVFGARTAREDDTERAVRTGLAVVDAVHDLNEADPALGLRVRVGIATGEVLLSLDAHADPGGHWATGMVINVAQRLQAAASPDTVVVSEATYRATAHVIEYEELEPVHAKGVSELLSAHRALRARLPFGAEVFLDLDIPLVGRELELRQLRTTFDRVVHEQSVQLVTVMGTPGVGKTRMVAELMAALPKDVTCRLGRVPPYGESTGFSALGEIVKAQAGVYDSDSADETAAKLAHALAGMEERDWMLPRLLSLLGVGVGPEISREDGFTAWRLYLEEIAGDGPALIVVEDIHQADLGLLSFLHELAEEAPQVPLMLVVTARPELLLQDPHWGGGLRNASLLSLLPLTDSETRLLLRSHLHGTALPAESEEAILARAEGNPLFTAEFVRMLRARDLIEPVTSGLARPFVDVPLPETVQGVIAARLDLVEGNTRTVLQDAAVFGRVFWTEALAAVTRREVTQVAPAQRLLAPQEIVPPVR